MQLHLITPVVPAAEKQPGDEEIHGKLWRVTGPYDITSTTPGTLPVHFHCVSYVWGPSTEKKGSFFNCERDISDQTRPALAAAIKAASVAIAQNESDAPIVEAFWIDAICIPQLEVPERYKTLESMGWIYSAATSVLIVLQRPIWHIIESVSAATSPRALTYQEMQILEQDTWISRVWTYQELVNAHTVFFTTLEPTSAGHAMRAEKFFNCVGFSLDTWKKATAQGYIAVLETFHNLDTLQDTLADRQLGDYLERTAFGVLSNMALRAFDAKFPQNRLLASLGALSQDVSWGPPSTTLAELAEKLMAICESKGDYSFVYTSDVRDPLSGRRWRPSPSQIAASEPANLVPVANWSTWGTQTGHRDLNGFWLDEMVMLKPADRIDDEVENTLEKILYGFPALQNSGIVINGIFRHKEGDEEDLSRVMLRFLRKIGFKGHGEPQVCKQGLFFSQLGFESYESVEIYAASSLRWTFGSPGLATWKENGESRYCAGVFVGVSKTEVPQSILLE